jgi:WD40 repeat protein
MYFLLLRIALVGVVVVAADTTDEPSNRIAELDAKVEQLTRAVHALGDKLTHIIEHQQQLASSRPRSLLAISLPENLIQLYDIDTGKLVSSLYGHRNLVSAFELLSPSLLVSASYDRCVRGTNTFALLPNLQLVCLLLQDYKRLGSGQLWRVRKNIAWPHG